MAAGESSIVSGEERAHQHAVKGALNYFSTVGAMRLRDRECRDLANETKSARDETIFRLSRRHGETVGN